MQWASLIAELEAGTPRPEIARRLGMKYDTLCANLTRLTSPESKGKGCYGCTIPEPGTPGPVTLSEKMKAMLNREGAPAVTLSGKGKTATSKRLAPKIDPTKPSEAPAPVTPGPAVDTVDLARRMEALEARMTALETAPARPDRSATGSIDLATVTFPAAEICTKMISFRCPHTLADRLDNAARRTRIKTYQICNLALERLLDELEYE